MKNMMNDRLIFIHGLYLVISQFNVLLSDNINDAKILSQIINKKDFQRK